jgi:hypothetical protein
MNNKEKMREEAKVNQGNKTMKRTIEKNIGRV